MRIFISSTSDDLQDYRTAVADQLDRLEGFEVISMEGYSAMPQGPLEKVLDDVASADVYILLFAFRYGSVPRGFERSFTELEFRQASDKNVPRLVFLVDEDANWKPRYFDKGEASIPMWRFRDELLAQDGFTAKLFKDKGELVRQCRLVDAKNLGGSARRVRHRTQKVEDGTDTDLPPRSGRIFHSSVKKRGVKKSDTDFIDARLDIRRGEIQLYSQAFEYIRAAAKA